MINGLRPGRTGPSPTKGARRLHEGTAGIGMVMAISSVVGLALAVLAVIAGLNAIFNG